MNASTQGGNHQLGRGDQNSPNSLVSNSEDLLKLDHIQSYRDMGNAYLFTVANHDVINVFTTAKIWQTFFYSVLVRNIQEAAFRSPEYSWVVLYSITFSRRINHPEHLFEVVLK